MSETRPEPWLRGTLTGEHPAIVPVLYSFEQALEDLAKFTDGMSDQELWARPFGLAPVGSQFRHIGGSIDRLLTYASGNQLSSEQMAELKSEMEPRGSQAELMEELRGVLQRAGERVRSIPDADLNQPRKVGRKELPTTVIGLLVHTAEHAQRHVGQAIVTAKLVRASSSADAHK